MKRLAALVVAMFMAWALGGAAIAHAVDVPSNAVTAHTCGRATHFAVTGSVDRDRGPPVHHDRSTTYDADGIRSLGALVRANSAKARAAYDYDCPRQLVRMASGRQTHKGRVGDPAAMHALVQRACVAANSADDLTRVGRWMSPGEHAASDAFAEQQSNVIDWKGTTVYGLLEFETPPSNVTLMFVSAKVDPVQGVQLRVRGGTLVVNGHESADVVLWQDSAPQRVNVEVRPSGRRTP